MPWGAAIAAVGSVAGAAIGGSKGSGGGSSGTQSSSNVPWDAQQQFLTDGFGQAKDIYNQRGANPLPTSYYAGTNGMQTAANQTLYDQGLASQGAFKNVMGSATPLLDGTANAYANTATNIAQGGIGDRNGSMSNLMQNYALTGTMPGSLGGADPSLVSSLSGAAQGSVGALGQSQAIANRVAGADPAAAMNATVAGADRYINNDVLNGQIDAVGTDIARNLGENTLYGIRAGAQTSGNVNSSREGALEAIGTRGAQDALANAAANIRGTAYQTGATLAANQYQQGQTNALQAAGTLNTTGSVAGSLGSSIAGLQQNQGQFDTSSRLGAANNAQAGDLAWNQANTGAMLTANGQLGTGLQIGASSTALGSQGALAALTASQGAGTYQQQQDQQAINNTNAAWQAQDQRRQQLLNDYWSVVGKPLGSSASTTSTSSTNGPGVLGGAIGGAVGAYGIYNNLSSDNADLFGSKGTFGLSSGANYKRQDDGTYLTTSYGR